MDNIPKHIVIIPDGNRRWAKERGVMPWTGHSAGAENLLELLRTGYEGSISHITFWGFSTENWGRDKGEVDMIMDLFLNFLKEHKRYFIENKISFSHFGRRDRLPGDLMLEIEKAEKETEDFPLYHFAVALDYGGRDEIERAIKKKEETKNQNGGVEVSFSECLDTAKFPDVDLIIRTGGEQRTSGILPWQSVYAEYYFSPLYFPEFKSSDLTLAIKDYSNRKRRFGR